uniref:Uncharacterized protein n=1 Tax=Setaria italica TaxID=4555 RepID=K3XTG0_SETIT
MKYEQTVNEKRREVLRMLHSNDQVSLLLSPSQHCWRNRSYIATFF